MKRILKGTDKDDDLTSPTVPTITQEFVVVGEKEQSTDMYNTVGTGKNKYNPVLFKLFQNLMSLSTKLKAKPVILWGNRVAS